MYIGWADMGDTWMGWRNLLLNVMQIDMIRLWERNLEKLLD